MFYCRQIPNTCQFDNIECSEPHPPQVYYPSAFTTLWVLIFIQSSSVFTVPNIQITCLSKIPIIHTPYYVLTAVIYHNKSQLNFDLRSNKRQVLNYRTTQNPLVDFLLPARGSLSR